LPPAQQQTGATVNQKGEFMSIGQARRFAGAGVCFARNLGAMTLGASLAACGGGGGDSGGSGSGGSIGLSIPSTPVTLAAKSDVSREVGNAINLFLNFDPGQQSLSPGDNAPFLGSQPAAKGFGGSNAYARKADGQPVQQRSGIAARAYAANAASQPVNCQDGGTITTKTITSIPYNYNYFGVTNNLSSGDGNTYSSCKRP
jgi:hypothetical protein